MSRSVSIFGLGYVGSVTAGCLSHLGHTVIGVDVNPAKVASLEAGRSTIIEPGLEALIADAHAAGRLHATPDTEAAVAQTDISFLCVGTPGQRNGKLELSHIEHACQEIGEALKVKDAFHLVVVRSTVLPGTTESVVIPALERASGKSLGKGFGVCVNPEFMREGTAVDDFLRPAITVVGATDPSHRAQLCALYTWTPGRLFETDIATAEMVKYVCNSWHALKVGFANEVGTLAKQFGVDVEPMMEVFLADRVLNVSPAYLRPGFAFGGSCLPKDLRALTYRANELDLRLPLLEAIMPSNQEHLERAVELVLRTGNRKVGMLGLAFKAATDDLRESPAVHLVKRLLGEGCQLQIWDENVALGQLIGSNRQYIEEVIPHLASLLRPRLEDVVQSAETIVIGTRGVDRQVMETLLRPQQVVIDLVNVERSRRLGAHPHYDGLCW